jgi:hypothetical protein
MGLTHCTVESGLSRGRRSLASALHASSPEDSMAERPLQRDREGESGEQRQQRIRRERHRPEQDQGYDEAVERPGIANDREVSPDERPRRDI